MTARRAGLAALLVAFVLAGSVKAAGDPGPAGDGTYEDLVRRWRTLLVEDVSRVPEIVKNGRPTLLAFIDKHCGYCLSMVPIVEQLQRDYEARLNILTVDNERLDLPVRFLVMKYQIWATPTLVVLDRKGAVYRKLHGPQARPRLEGLLERVLSAR